MRVLFEHKNGRRELMALRYAKILSRLKRGSIVREGVEGVDPIDSESIDELRARYQQVVGKRPFHAWNAEQLSERIDAALAGVDN